MRASEHFKEVCRSRAQGFCRPIARAARARFRGRNRSRCWLSAAIRSNAAREARLADAGSVEYKTILNGLAMCVSSYSKRTRRSSRRGPLGGACPARIGPKSQTAAAGIPMSPSLRDPRNESRQRTAPRGAATGRANWSIPNVSRLSHAVRLALAVGVIGIAGAEQPVPHHRSRRAGHRPRR